MKCEHHGFRDESQPYECNQCGKGIGKARVCYCGHSLLNSPLKMTGERFYLECGHCGRETDLYKPPILDATTYIVLDIETTGLATQPFVVEYNGVPFRCQHEIIEIFAAWETPHENRPLDEMITFHQTFKATLPPEFVYEGSRWIFDHAGPFGERGNLVSDFKGWMGEQPMIFAGRSVQDFDFRFLNDTVQGWDIKPLGFLDCASFFGKRISLDECVKQSGLQRSGVHRARADVWDTIRVIRKQLGIPATMGAL